MLWGFEVVGFGVCGLGWWWFFSGGLSSLSLAKVITGVGVFRYPCSLMPLYHRFAVCQNYGILPLLFCEKLDQIFGVCASVSTL